MDCLTINRFLNWVAEDATTLEEVRERAVRGALIECPDIRIHTGNPAGFKKMNLAREAILRFVTKAKEPSGE